jgi:hypothetical protein
MTVTSTPPRRFGDLDLAIAAGAADDDRVIGRTDGARALGCTSWSLLAWSSSAPVMLVSDLEG